MPHGDRSTPEFVGTTNAETTATTASVTKPTNAIAGDLLMIGLTLFDSSLTTVTSTGWTQLFGTSNTSPGNGHCFNVLWRIHDGSAGPFTVAWDGSSQFYDVSCVAYRAESGIDTSASLATTVSSSTVFRGPSVTTAAPNESVVMYGTAANTGASITIAPPAGFVERLDLPQLSTGRHYIADTVFPRAGATGNQDATLGLADADTVALIALTSGPRPTPIPPESGSHSPGLAGPGAEDRGLGDMG